MRSSSSSKTPSLPEGTGAMYDFPGQADIQNILAFFKDDGRIISAVCHGPAAFADAKTKDGKYVVDGVKLTGFTNEEENRNIIVILIL